MKHYKLKATLASLFILCTTGVEGHKASTRAISWKA